MKEMQVGLSDHPARLTLEALGETQLIYLQILPSLPLRTVHQYTVRDPGINTLVNFDLDERERIHGIELIGSAFASGPLTDGGGLSMVDGKDLQLQVPREAPIRWWAGVEEERLCFDMWLAVPRANYENCYPVPGVRIARGVAGTLLAISFAGVLQHTGGRPGQTVAKGFDSRGGKNA